MQLIKAFHIRMTGKCVGNNVYCKHSEVTHVSSVAAFRMFV